MDAQQLFEYQWSYLCTFLPPEEELERTARELGALVRKRGIPSASALLRLILVYSVCGFSLRQTAAWAEVAEVASISDVALLKRLRKASGWMGRLLAIKLAERAPPPPFLPALQLRLVDATCLNQPASTGTDWRLHLGFDLARLAIDHIELTDASGGETLTRFVWRPGDLVIGDRGYAHRRGLHDVVAAQADFLIRLNWQNVPLQTRDGRPFELIRWLRQMPEAVPIDVDVQVAPSERPPLPELPARLVAVRKSEAAAEDARRKVLKARRKKGRTIDPRTLEAAGYVFVLTSVPRETLDTDSVLHLYRLRWQIELAFKRLKSLLQLDHVPAKDPALARCFLYGKLLAALLIEDLTQRFLDFSPWGYRLEPTLSVPVEDSARPPGRDVLRPAWAR